MDSGAGVLDLSKLKVTKSLGWSEGSSRTGETRGTTQPAQTARPQDEEEEEEGRRRGRGRRTSNTASRGGREERGEDNKRISKKRGRVRSLLS